MSMPNERTLLVLRHSKAAREPAESDEERPLTKRGRRNASAAGEWLLAEGLLPDRVLCSSALRARQTWQRVSSALGEAASRVTVSIDPRVYHANAADLLELVRDQPEDAGIMLTVGHNPACEELVTLMTGEAGFGFPTSALAVVRIRGSWAGAAPGRADLVALWTPRAPA